jgi:5-methyltetrahydropteroyltriglutamate--homocysteine methyltransferase
MADLIATTPGLLPLPDWAKDELSTLKGHQKSDLIDGGEGPTVSGVYDRVRQELVDAQLSAGIDHIGEGQARWDDMLAHPLVMADGVETRGIVRYYDNNNFYREPVITDALEPSGDVGAELAETDTEGRPVQTVLPGPYSLFDLATDEHYQDRTDCLAAVAELLAAEIEQLPDHETLFLLEPSLVESPPTDEFAAAASQAIDRVADASAASVVVHTYFGAIPEEAYAHLMDASVDAIGFDFVTDHESTLYNIQEYGTKPRIAMGVVDGQNTLVESPAAIDDRVDWVRDQLPGESFDTIYVTSNTELLYLPMNKAIAKLEALGATVAADTEVSA